MVITPDTTVRHIVVEQPSAIPVLEQLGIDYCCAGKHTLAVACSRRKHDVGAVIAELQRRQRNNKALEINWQTAPVRDLIDYIVRHHHGFTRRQLDLIHVLITKVGRCHGAAHLAVAKISGAMVSLTDELTHHFSCEENVLFPGIAQLEKGELALRNTAFTGIQLPVTRMIMDHHQTGDQLRSLRETASNYRPPSNACTTYRALYRALEDLERDLHQHIHLENNILFPRAIRLESEVPIGISSIAGHR